MVVAFRGAFFDERAVPNRLGGISGKILPTEFANNLSRSGLGGKFVLHWGGAFFAVGQNLNCPPTVTPPCSRKSFLARLGGLLAAVGIAPALLGRGEAPVAGLPAAPVKLRPESRAVARKEGSC